MDVRGPTKAEWADSVKPDTAVALLAYSKSPAVNVAGKAGATGTRRDTPYPFVAVTVAVPLAHVVARSRIETHPEFGAV